MRMRNILPACLLVLAGGEALAQVKVENASVKKEKREVAVRFELNEMPTHVKSRQKLVLQPYLHAGADTLWLEPVQLYGNLYYRRERQEQLLAGNKAWEPGGYDTRLKDGRVEYSERVRYERWMKTAGLGIAYHVEGCGCECCEGDQQVPAGAVYVAPVPELKPVEAKRFEVVEPSKRWNFSEKNMRVFFPVAKTVLNPDAYDNRAVLDEIISVIVDFASRQTSRLRGVEISGFASPEGGMALNMRLAKGRAEALKNYIQGEMPALRDEDFVIENGAEDWVGLRAMVAASRMEYRDEVLAILDDSTQGTKRKVALMSLKNGRPYRYMLKTFYPELRNACYVSVIYDVLGDRAANAVSAANELIRGGDYAGALRLLEPYREDDRVFNSIGVCYMMMEEEETAIEWFEKALRAGHAEAEKNLKQLK